MAGNGKRKKGRTFLSSERALCVQVSLRAMFSALIADAIFSSYGPRKCPGRQFAMIEIKVHFFVPLFKHTTKNKTSQALVAILLRQFMLSPVPEKPIEPFQSFVVRARVQGQTGSKLPLHISKITY